MARRIGTLVAFALAAGLIFGTLSAARWKMEAEAAAEVKATSAPTSVATPKAKPRPTKVVYLTFDDGPDPTWTPRVLGLLARHQARATFFVLGNSARSHPGLVARIRAGGHAVGNHSVSHKSLPSLSPGRLHREIAGGVRSRCFRPPYGATSARVRTAIRKAGMRQVLWDVDPQDWRRPGAAAISQRILSQVGNGSIVLMHDGGGDRAQTARALDRVLTTLAARGYAFRPLSC